MNDQERKISDVVLNIEATVLELKKHLTLLNTSNKIILDRTNKIYNYIDKLEKELEVESQIKNVSNPNQQQSFAAPLTSIFDKEEPVQSQQEEQIFEVDENPLGTRRTSRVANTLTPEMKEVAKNIPGSERKVPVLQRITNHQGKDVMMANVSILSEDGKELIIKTTTNAMGKWQTSLFPGKYVVHLVKNDQKTKEKIEAKQLIIVPPMTGILQLPVAAIKKAE